MKNKEITKLWPRFVGWFFIAIISLGFGIEAVITAIQKMTEIADSEDAWDGILKTIVSLLFLLEGFLFVFFIYYSSKMSIKLWLRIDTIREETGIKAERSKRKAEKSAKKQVKAENKAEKEVKKHEALENKKSDNSNNNNNLTNTDSEDNDGI